MSIENKKIEITIFALCRYFETTNCGEIAKLLAKSKFNVESYEKEDGFGFSYPVNRIIFYIPLDDYLSYLHDEQITDNIQYNFSLIAQEPKFANEIKFEISDTSFNENWRDAYLYSVSSNISKIKEYAESCNFEIILKQIERLEAFVDSDPDLAIGTSKEMLESTCKTILELRQIQFSKNSDLNELLKITRKELKLIPEETQDARRGYDLVKRILTNLGSIGSDIGELRNLYGTGHGPSGNNSRKSALQPRHARLVVGASVSLCVFLFETHEYLATKK